MEGRGIINYKLEIINWELWIKSQEVLSFVILRLSEVRAFRNHNTSSESREDLPLMKNPKKAPFKPSMSYKEDCHIYPKKL